MDVALKLKSSGSAGFSLWLHLSKVPFILAHCSEPQPDGPRIGSCGPFLFLGGEEASATRFASGALSHAFFWAGRIPLLK